MKREYITIIVVFMVLLFATPVVFGAVHGGGRQKMEFPETISLLLTESGETIELSVEEYLVGALFAQIPVAYHEQALKAQAIAAHTYLLRLLLNRLELKESQENQGQHLITDDPATCQPFFTLERAREHHGEAFDEHIAKVRRAARYAAGRVILHDGEPIYAVYHSISAGVTNTAYSVWGRDFPYLRSVESSWDREHPDFLSVNEMTAETIRLAMFDYNRAASMPIDYALWFTNPILNEFGYVISVAAGENLLSGGDMWRIFRLRSTAFEISFRDGGIFSITTRGFGHGAGLSQFGADVLARRGFSYYEILNHYYTGVSISQI